MGLTPESMAYQKLELAEKALCRAGDLNRQLMTFSKGSDLIRRPSQVDQLLTDAIDLSLKGNNVQWELDVEPSVSTIDVDEGQINQVLNNLLINARQAMPDGGVVHISAENTTVQRGHPIAFETGSLCPNHGQRPGSRHCPPDASKSVRSLFYHQTGWKRFGTVHCLQNCQGPRRSHCRVIGPEQRHPVSCVSPRAGFLAIKKQISNIEQEISNAVTQLAQVPKTLAPMLCVGALTPNDSRDPGFHAGACEPAGGLLGLSG